MAEVIQEFHQELAETMRGLQQRVQDPPLQLRGEARGLPAAGAEAPLAGPELSPVSERSCCLPDAVLLNNIVQNFGMLDLVKKVLASHKCQMDRSREQYARDLAGAPPLPGSHRCQPGSWTSGDLGWAGPGGSGGRRAAQGCQP